MTNRASNLGEFRLDGFTMLRAVFAESALTAILQGLQEALARPNQPGTISCQAGGVYAARNVQRLWPAAAAVWRQPPLPEVLTAMLGPGFGLVRVLYFDKPPEQTWALPWHKDMTIAVRDLNRPSPLFTKPTIKAGVPHVEAPEAVLEAMVTARIHLDDVTEANGPLKVIPGSHRSGKSLALDGAAPCTILGARGDVLLMRPLLAHSSGHSHAGTHSHRRILHLEFAASAQLPDGYAWHEFLQ